MENLKLRRLELSDEAAFIKTLDEWDHDVGFTWVRGYEHGMDFSQYLASLEAAEKGVGLPEGFVPDTSLFGFVGPTIVGRLAIRHKLNAFLMKVGGHIGYGVLPPFRRRGYAKAMLRLSLPFVRELGIERVLVTCDEGNTGSIKTIEANGGVLENIIAVDCAMPLKRRYWIDVSVS